MRVRFPILVHPSDDDLINRGFQDILAEAIDAFMREDGFPEALQPRLHLALVILPAVIVIELRSSQIKLLIDNLVFALAVLLADDSAHP